MTPAPLNTGAWTRPISDPPRGVEEAASCLTPQGAASAPSKTEYVFSPLGGSGLRPSPPRRRFACAADSPTL